MRSVVALLASMLLLCCTKSSEPPSAPSAPSGAKSDGVKQPKGRLVILGFDGVDPRRVETLVKAGKLPNISALGAGGYRGPLQSTNPPQSPVAWSAFATGMPAGRHGIFDFIGRDPRTYFPRIATTKVRHARVEGGTVTAAEVDNLRNGEAFWDVIARAGIKTKALAVPYNYPPPPAGATALAGLGMPDARGINSSFTLLTTDPQRAKDTPPAGGQVALLSPLGKGAWRAMVSGPTARVDGNRQPTQAQVVVRTAGKGLKIEIGGTTHTLAKGETSPYLTVQFVPALALTIDAATRVTVRAGAPKPELYLEPLSVLPSAPYFPVSNPGTFAADLWKKLGPFKTVGWVHDTSALGAGAIDDQQFVSEAMATMAWRRKALVQALKGRAESLLVAVFTAPDRIGHMWYRYLDTEHPAYDKDAAKSIGGLVAALDHAYVAMDAVVGEVRRMLGPNDTLLCMSDHGFASFRRGINLNTWLKKQGYLVLKPGVKSPRDFFQDVDWGKTRAYALGTGSIYLNQRGREARGIVPSSKTGALAREIGNKLLALRDGSKAVIPATYLGDEVYQGPARFDAPDVRVAMAPGYRASWATTLGGIPEGLFEDNKRKWSGDHASAKPEDVPGFLVSPRPLALPNPRIEDLAATAYHWSGVSPPAGVVGRSLLPRL